MYANGRIPLSLLVHLGGDHYLPAGTAARWLWLVDMAWRKYGVLLRITAGWNGYRPYDIQVEYRTELGIWAAVPGFSSHGGTYRGQEVFAVDVANWAELGWARFVALCRLAGFTVNFVTPEELWHIGDFNNPWVVPAFASGGGGSALNPGSTTTLILKEEEMKESYIWWRDAAGNQQNLIYAVGGNGGQEFWTSGDGAYNTRVANGHNLAGPSYEVSPGHAQNVLNMLAEQRAA